MVKSDDLWATGKVESSYKHQLREYLKENSHTYFNPMELTEPIFDLKPMKEDWKNIDNGFEDQTLLNDRMRRALFIEIILDDLVNEGIVEKRSIRISDKIDLMHEENPEIFNEARKKTEEEFGEELPEDFRGKKELEDSRGVWYRITREEFEEG